MAQTKCLLIGTSHLLPLPITRLHYLFFFFFAQFGRGAKKDIRSATATTTEMMGKLNLRVLHGGAATLHSIKVMQPKQVSIKTLQSYALCMCSYTLCNNNLEPQIMYTKFQTVIYLIICVYELHAP